MFKVLSSAHSHWLKLRKSTHFKHLVKLKHNLFSRLLSLCWIRDVYGSLVELDSLAVINNLILFEFIIVIHFVLLQFSSFLNWRCFLNWRSTFYLLPFVSLWFLIRNFIFFEFVQGFQVSLFDESLRPRSLFSVFDSLSLFTNWNQT